ncbi:MAG: FAD:protein FMN transferase [Telmatospirillum sp.]|nr:FAD:protein FMN transferase [Telmatospirillum sp.]
MLNRRRFLTVTAAAGALALSRGRPARAADPLIWRGNALGADASLILYAGTPGEARALLRESLSELERLERIFSLYREDSHLVRLNREGRLDTPPAELVELLTISRHLSQLSDGAFDVTVQPLWTLYAAHFTKTDADPRGPAAAALAETVRRVDWRAVTVDPRRISFDTPGMAITLNGIAQGYITDRIADHLKARGLRHVLVDMGEIRAVGPRPDGTPWRAALEGGGQVGLDDRALSTSSPDGTRFSPTCNHLFDPKTGGCSQAAGTVSVLAPTATLADALSTAIAIGGPRLGMRLAETLGSVGIFYGTRPAAGT